GRGHLKTANGDNTVATEHMPSNKRMNLPVWPVTRLALSAPRPHSPTEARKARARHGPRVIASVSSAMRHSPMNGPRECYPPDPWGFASSGIRGRQHKIREFHGVSFEEAMTVFGDPLARLHDDLSHAQHEHREIIVGHSRRGRLLLISFAERPDG